MDTACPACETENCWFVRDKNPESAREANIEIWRCENGHEFEYTPGKGPSSDTTWGNWRWWR